ncbi:MAG: hypothetical protein ACC642_07450, partial [Pseudomonadales bacterium]
HWLHIWLGYYDNAFQLMRECYAELDRDPAQCPIAGWQDAFTPANYIGLTDPQGDGSWHRLMAAFPACAGLPGGPYEGPYPVGMSDYLVRGVKLLLALLESAAFLDKEVNVESDRTVFRPFPAGDAAADEDSGSISETIVRYVRYGQMATLTAVAEAIGLLEPMIRFIPLVPKKLALEFLDLISDSARRLLEPMLDGNKAVSYIWEILDLVLAHTRGVVKYSLLTDPRGLDAINDYDARELLRECGAAERALNSTFLRGLYDLAFAYEDGDPNKPRLAAGQGFRGGMRMFFGYRGALFWKMEGGMGDIVFAPLYEVLKRRGVRFEFFHRLENVSLADDTAEGKPYVDALQFDVQANLSGDSYQPLVEINGVPSWPATPDWGQLADGAELAAEGWNFESYWDRRAKGQKELRVGEDFDFLVLGVSLGAIPRVCGDFLERDQKWRDMVANVKTVATQCFQLWMDRGMPELGWDDQASTMSGFTEPFDTWSDMTHLLRHEDWQQDPAAIAYFCNVLPDSREGLERQRETVRENAIRFMNEEMIHLWPQSAGEDGGFDWSMLADSERSADESESHREHPFDSQFWTANVNPTDRYVLSLPGTLKYRISPLDDTYANFTIAGDWTDCGFNFGCVEAAVMSGRLAATALSEYPALEDIYGYDHP